jgi:hypothetical protein
MERGPTRQHPSGWLRQMLDGASNAFASRRREATAVRFATAATRGRRQEDRTSQPRGRTADVRRLAAQGLDRTEIARRTALAQDTVSLLLNLPSIEAAETAGGGTFFRLLETRIRD